MYFDYYDSLTPRQYNDDVSKVVLIHGHIKSKTSFTISLFFIRFVACMHACFFSLACSFFSFFSPCACTLFLILSRSFVCSFVRSFVVSERYCDKYLSRRRATLMRKKSKKPIDYLSFSHSLSSLSLTAYWLCVYTTPTSLPSLTTRSKTSKNSNNLPPPLLLF